MSGGVPPSSRARSRRPASTSRDGRRVADLYERFSGHEAELVGVVKVPPIPKAGAVIGTVDGLLYTTVRDGRRERYIHNFKAADRPLLVVSPDGRQLFLLGGDFDFTERGIVDRSDPTSHRRRR